MKVQTERLGVAALDFYFSQNGWLFREQLTHDYGIDAHVEILEGSYPTGKLIAIQIKSGTSFFSEETADYYIYRTEDKHVNYWLNHSMPVILAIYHPDLKQIFWQHISNDTIVSTGKSWKILIPKTNTFDEDRRSLQLLLALTQPEPYTRKLNRLRIDKRWLDMIEAGQEVYVNFDNWINKSLPRFQLTLSCNGEKQIWPLIYTPKMDILDVLTHYIPWADFSLNQEEHEAAAVSDWEAQCYGYRDNETGETYYSETFDEWYKPQTGIIPIMSDGEVDSYSLLLSLNSLGQAFLTVDEYLDEASDFEDRTFTLK